MKENEDNIKLKKVLPYYKLEKEDLLNVFDEYSDLLNSYAKKIHGKDFEISGKEKEELVLDMLLMTLKDYDSRNEMPNKEEVKSKLEENVHVREVLKEKLGIKLDYKIQGLIGDHGVYQSRDFTFDDIKGIDVLDITKEEFRTISTKYFNNIHDVIEKNNLLKMQTKYELSDISDDVPADLLKENFFEFLNGNKELNLKNKVYMQEMMNLIRTYDKESLLNGKTQIQNELSSGLYEFVKYPNNCFKDEERKELDKLTSIWEEEDFRNFKNLELLNKRYNDISSGNEEKRKDIEKYVKSIDKILNSKIPTAKNAQKVKDKMTNLYKSFEYENRNDIINHLASPKNDTIIKKREEIPESMLIHVYDPEVSEIFENVFSTIMVDRCKRKVGDTPYVTEKIPVRKYADIKDEIKKELKRFENQIDVGYIKDAANELKPGVPFKFEDEDIIFRKDVLQKQEQQIACRLSVPDEIEDIDKENGGLSFAVRF